MSKHTPGPWVAIESMGDFLIQTENGYTIGDVLGEGNSYSDEEERERWYNAHLIAAAPDMLEALEEAIKCRMVPSSSVKDGGASRHSRQVAVADMIRAAIAKATGN